MHSPELVDYIDFINRLFDVTTFAQLRGFDSSHVIQRWRPIEHIVPGCLSKIVLGSALRNQAYYPHTVKIDEAVMTKGEPKQATNGQGQIHGRNNWNDCEEEHPPHLSVRVPEKRDIVEPKESRRPDNDREDEIQRIWDEVTANRSDRAQPGGDGRGDGDGTYYRPQYEVDVSKPKNNNVKSEARETRSRGQYGDGDELIDGERYTDPLPDAAPGDEHAGSADADNNNDHDKDADDDNDFSDGEDGITSSDDEPGDGEYEGMDDQAGQMKQHLTNQTLDEQAQKSENRVNVDKTNEVSSKRSLDGAFPRFSQAKATHFFDKRPNPAWELRRPLTAALLGSDAVAHVHAQAKVRAQESHNRAQSQAQRTLPKAPAHSTRANDIQQILQYLRNCCNRSIAIDSLVQGLVEKRKSSGDCNNPNAVGSQRQRDDTLTRAPSMNHAAHPQEHIRVCRDRISSTTAGYPIDRPPMRPPATTPDHWIHALAYANTRHPTSRNPSKTPSRHICRARKRSPCSAEHAPGVARDSTPIQIARAMPLEEAGHFQRPSIPRSIRYRKQWS